jgi:sugar diacid utilization regulator
VFRAHDLSRRDMTAAGPEPGASEGGRLASLEDLLLTSMLITESGDEDGIVDLATSSVASIGGCRLEGVYLRDGGSYRIVGGAVRESNAGVEPQFAVLGRAGGALSVSGHVWSWAFPLRTLESDFGYLVVGADEEPSQADQFLVRVLAQQTGVSLANARLRSRDADIAAELRNANAALAETVAALQRSKSIHDRLTRVAVEGEGQAGIARALHEVTGYTTLVEDRHGNVRASAGNASEHHAKDAPARREELIARALAAGAPIRDRDRLFVVAGPDEQPVGVIALVDPERTAGETERVALEHAATVLSVELARLRSVEEIELRLRGDLAELLLSGADEESAFTRAQLQGYDLARPHRVAVIEVDEPDEEVADALFQAVRRAARDSASDALLVQRGRGVVVLAEEHQSWAALRDAVLERLGGGRRRVAFGVGRTCGHPRDLPRSHREAQLALRVRRVVGRDAPITQFDDLGIFGLLSDIDDAAAVERFAREWLGSLLAYDERHHAELVATLARYLERGGSSVNTANALSVHRNTLKYRLRRVREVSGHDLNDPETLFNLQLAVRVWEMLAVLRNDDPNLAYRERR